MRYLSIILFFVSFTVYSQTNTVGRYVSGTGIVFVNLNNLYSDTARIGTTSNYTSIWKDGTVRSYGLATCYEDLMFPFQVGNSGGSTYPTFVPDSGYWNFSAVDTTGPTQCIMYFTVQMPHSWVIGSTIHPHIHYKHETAVGTPKFTMRYKWTNIGDHTPNVFSRYYMSTTTGTANNTQQLVYNATGISGTGKTLSSILTILIYLYAAPVNVKAYQFDIHYERDGLGSRTELNK